MTVSAHQRLLAAIRRENTDRVPVAPRHYDPTFQVQSLGLPGEPEYFVDPAAEPELFRVGLPTLRVNIPAALDHAERLGYDPVFFKGIRLGLPAGTSVSHSRLDNGDLLLVTSIYDTPAGRVRKIERSYRDANLQLLASHGASPDRMQEYLVKKPGDLEALRYLTDHSRDRELVAADFADTLAVVGERGLVFAEAPHPMMLAVEFYGFENFLMAMVLDPGFTTELLAICQQETMGHLRRVLDMGAEVVYMDGVFSTPRLIAPAHFDKFLSPLIDEYVSILHAHGAHLHLFVDGPCFSVLSLLRDLGVDMVSPMDPPPAGDADMARVKREVGDGICYMGGVNAPDFLAKVSRTEVVKHVRAVMEAAPERGFILSTADSVQPGTPVDNYLAMIETALDAGSRR